MKSRSLLTIIPVVLAAMVTMAVVKFCSPTKKSAELFSMDTYITIAQYGGDIDATVGVIEKANQQLDMYSGQLMEINGNNEDADGSQASAVFGSTLELNGKYGYSVDVTAGALTSLWGIGGDNPHVPTQEQIQQALATKGTEKVTSDDMHSIRKPLETKLDFGAVAKGYTCDQIAAELTKDKSVKCCIVSMGSSSLLYGQKPDGSRFNVEIRNPDGKEIPLGTLETDACFISTSGGYERYFEADGKRYCHILDLTTGYPVESDLVSVTVIASGENSGTLTDFLSTSIFIGGTQGLSEHLCTEEYKVIAADVNGKVYISEGLDFTLSENSGYSL